MAIRKLDCEDKAEKMEALKDLCRVIKNHKDDELTNTKFICDVYTKLGVLAAVEDDFNQDSVEFYTPAHF